MATKKKAADTVEAVESEQPQGVETIEQAAAGYTVAWTIKVNGKRHQPGERIDLADELAAPFLASGAIVASQ